MKLKFFDPNVSDTMNVFLVIANIINLVYNLPQIYKTYKTKSTGDFSEWFLFLRIVGNVIWIPYSIEIGSTLMLVNTLVTVASSIFIGYYKVREIINKKRYMIYNKFTSDNRIMKNRNVYRDTDVILEIV
jgi:MtN3 and saliva related transmembrane protein